MSTTTATISRPTTPSDPVIIPMRGRETPRETQRSEARKEHRHNSRRQSERSERRARDVHSPDAIPPSVAALLAITSIPPQRLNASIRKRSGAGQRLTVDAILKHTGVSEKELSLSLGRSPMDLLLSPPEELEEDEVLGSENGMESVLSTRTMSSESMPSLDDESVGEDSPSLGSLVTPGSRGRRSLPTRRMQPVSAPPGESASEDHPLSALDLDIDELDFKVFQKPEDKDKEKPEEEATPPRRKAAFFKSNLTASIRAFKLAAKSFGTLTTPLMTPDDFLTRSIVNIDPQVPFTDERMPKLEDTPTPALRRYLNPTTNAPIEAHVPSSLAQTTSTTKCTASIQMQTYKVSRSSKGTSPSVISRRTLPTSEDVSANVAAGLVARQRDMRENSDFIRIAVMEMAMRKKGKLDDQKPGRARWALPPRQPPTKPYEIGENGVPVRWIAVTQ